MSPSIEHVLHKASSILALALGIGIMGCGMALFGMIMVPILVAPMSTFLSIVAAVSVLFTIGVILAIAMAAAFILYTCLNDGLCGIYNLCRGLNKPDEIKNPKELPLGSFHRNAGVFFHDVCDDGRLISKLNSTKFANYAKVFSQDLKRLYPDDKPEDVIQNIKNAYSPTDNNPLHVLAFNHS